MLVAIDDRHLLLGSFLLYLLPLLVMFAGCLIADTWLSETAKENWLIPISLVSLLTGFGLARRWQHGLIRSCMKPSISETVQ